MGILIKILIFMAGGLCGMIALGLCVASGLGEKEEMINTLCDELQRYQDKEKENGKE